MNYHWQSHEMPKNKYGSSLQIIDARQFSVLTKKRPDDWFDPHDWFFPTR